MLLFMAICSRMYWTRAAFIPIKGLRAGSHHAASMAENLSTSLGDTLLYALLLLLMLLLLLLALMLVCLFPLRIASAPSGMGMLDCNKVGFMGEAAATAPPCDAEEKGAVGKRLVDAHAVVDNDDDAADLDPRKEEPMVDTESDDGRCLLGRRLLVKLGPLAAQQPPPPPRPRLRAPCPVLVTKKRRLLFFAAGSSCRVPTPATDLPRRRRAQRQAGLPLPDG
jgi:hypothetical protein